MELPNLGAQCSLQSCRQLDFLPFKCPRCGLVFCDEHKKPEDHICTEPEPSKGNTTVDCPFCYAVLLIRVGEDPNAVVDRHHASGECKKAVNKLKSGICSYEGCRITDAKAIIKCKSCNRQFCMEHRFHECSELKRSDGPPPATKIQPKTSAAKWRASALGDKTIRHGDRVYLDVVIHPTIKANPPISPAIWRSHDVIRVLIFAHRDDKVRNVTDRVAEAIGVSRDSSFNLFLAPTIPPLPKDTTIGVVGSSTANTAVVSVIYRGSELSEWVVPNAPSTVEPKMAHIKLRLPDGSIERRLFLPSATLHDVGQVASVLLDRSVSEFVIPFPHRVLTLANRSIAETTIAGLGLVPNGTLIVNM